MFGKLQCQECVRHLGVLLQQADMEAIIVNRAHTIMQNQQFSQRHSCADSQPFLKGGR